MVIQITAAGSGTSASPLSGWKIGDWIGPGAASVSQFAFADGDLRVTPLPIPASQVVDGFSFEVTNAGSTGSLCRAVIYQDADGDGRPETLVADLGTVSGETIGLKQITGLAVNVSDIDQLWGGVVNQGGASTRAGLRYITAHSRPAVWAAPSLGMTVSAMAVTGISGAAPTTVAFGPASGGGARYAIRRGS